MEHGNGTNVRACFLIMTIFLAPFFASCGDFYEDEGAAEDQIVATPEDVSPSEVLGKAIDYNLDPAGYAYGDIGLGITFYGSSASAHIVGLSGLCPDYHYCTVELWDTYTVSGPFSFTSWDSDAWLSFSANLCEYSPERDYVALATVYDDVYFVPEYFYFSDFVTASIAASQSSAIHAQTGAHVGDILYRDGPPLGFGHAGIYYGKDKYGNDLLIESNTITDVCGDPSGGVRIVYADDSLAGNNWYGAFYPDTPVDWVDIVMDGECQLGSSYDFVNTHQPVTSCGAKNGAFRCDGFTHYLYGQQGVDLSVHLLEIPSPYAQMMRDNLRARRPKMIGVDVNPSIFEPSLGQNVSISLKGTNSDFQWTLVIKNSLGHAVRTIYESGKWATFPWDGKDGGGSHVPAGDYTINVSATSGGPAVSYYRDSSTVLVQGVTVLHTATCPDGYPPTAFCGGPTCIPGWDFVPGDVLISFHDGTTQTASVAIVDDIINVLGASGATYEYHSSFNTYVVHLPGDVSIGCAINIATGHSEVEYVGPNTIVHAFGLPPPIDAVDADEDLIENSVDNCPDVHNISQADIDEDGIGDVCDSDRDGDGYPNDDDDFPIDAGEWEDADGDDLGNNVDFDDDGDGVVDSMDAFPYDPAEYVDTDEDGVGDNADSDDDDDGVDDDEDLFPRDPGESTDNDDDRIGDNADPDDDNDGTDDVDDAFPLDSGEAKDSDSDGLGDNADPDDDNDGVADEDDAFPLDASKWEEDVVGTGNVSKPETDEVHGSQARVHERSLPPYDALDQEQGASSIDARWMSCQLSEGNQLMPGAASFLFIGLTILLSSRARRRH